MELFNHRRGDVFVTDHAHIYFEAHGSKDAAPLLFLHGGMGTIEDFNPLLEHLKGDYRIIGVDARGHGRSTLGNVPLTYEQLEKDAIAVLDHLGIKHVVIIGFSDGGIVGYRMALHARDRVRALVAIGAPCKLPAQTQQILVNVTAESWKQKFPETFESYQNLNPEPRFEDFMAASKGMWLDASCYPAADIQRITCPTLIVRGDDDHLFSLEEAVEIRTSIKNSTLLNVPSAGHVAFAERADVCAKVIDDFVRITRDA
jgi:pimeloyl-ACP methyl ester carboxylesterase